MPEEDLQSLDREQRLDEAVTAFLEEQESGRRPRREEWLARYPEVAAELQQFFTDQDEVDRLTGPLRTALHVTPSPDDTPQPGRPDGVLSALSPSALATPPLRHSATPPEGYELLQVLGQGGMGLVYKARQKSAGRLVALKLIRAERLTSESDVLRFRNEAEAAAQLDHPHIVPVYEVSARPGHFFFSMKLIEGGGLDEQLERFRDDLPGAARLISQVARAVHHAHQRGILHRDLKPSNILLDQEGQPHVSDFGLAKRMEADSSLTQTGAIVGTPQYMAPEQTSGRKGAVTTATDVYGLGAVLYALLTGRPPFRGETVLETLEQVRLREPEPPRRSNAKVDRDLETICLKCIEKEPEQRYGSAQALAEELESWLRGEPIQARRIGWGRRLWRWCRRNPSLAFVSGLAVAALISTAVVSLVFAFREAQNAKNLGDALAASDTNRRDAERRLAENYLDQGLNLCEQGEIGVGLHWLVRALETVPEDQADLQWVIRANLAGWAPRLHALTAILEHQDAVLAVVFTPDGKTILTGSEDGTVRFWNTATGKHLDQDLTLPGGVRALALSPDSRTLVTVSGEQNKRIWGAQGYTDPMTRKNAGGTIHAWDVATGNRLSSPLSKCGNTLAVAFAPDGQTLAIAGRDRTVQLRQANTGNLRCQPLPHPEEVWTIAFSPDGKRIAAGGLGPGVRLWETATGRPTSRTFGPNQGSCFALSWSPDGQWIATASSNYKAQIWDAVTGKDRGFVLQHRDFVSAVAFSPDSQMVLTGSYDKTARLWDAKTGKSIGQPMAHPTSVQAVAFSPDGESFVTADWGRTARLWRRSTTETWPRRVRYTDIVSAATFGLDGRTLLTAHEDRAVRLCDATTGKILWKTPLLSSDGHTLAFSPTGQLAAAAECYMGKIHVWKVPSGELVGQFPHPRVSSLAFSPDGRFLLTGGDKARLWAVGAAKVIDWTLPHTGKVNAVSFSRDGRLLLTGGSDKTVRRWDATTGRPIGEALRHAGSVEAVAFSLDDRTILSATDNGLVYRWDRGTGAPLGQPLQPQDTRGGSPLYSPDGRIVLSAFGDGVVQLRDVPTGKYIGPPLRHFAGMPAIAFGPDGRSLLTRDSGGRVAQLWQIPAPLTGERDRVRCWIESITGLESDSDGTMHVLDAPRWQQRQRLLSEMDGSF